MNASDRSARRFFYLGVAALLLGPALGQDRAAVIGRPVSAVIDELRATGLPLAYSTTLVPPQLTVVNEPRATDPLEWVREILEPHNLALRSAGALYLVVRAEPTPAVAPTGSALVTLRDVATGAPIGAAAVTAVSAGLRVEPLTGGRLRLTGLADRRYGITFAADGFEPRRESVRLTAAGVDASVELTPLVVAPPEMVVTASRYELLRELVNAPFRLDQRAIAEQPDFGDDPLRALHRLPGMAAGGASAKAHVRGGAEDETAIVLNGQRLLDPFHIRDYQSLFSAIDARAIEGIEVYAGGFPARYGDRIGGLVLIDGLSPDRQRHTELGLSVYNTSVLSAGTIGDGTGDWLVSARRGNLDMFVNEELGEPTYYDFFGELGVNFSPVTRVSVNALTAQDRVLLVTEADPTEREEVSNITGNHHLWVHWEQQWSGTLSSSTTFSAGAFDSARIGLIDDPEKIVATLRDRRGVTINGVRQDWTAALGQRHELSWGAEYQTVAAEYDYTSTADYFGFFRTFAGVPTAIRRSAAFETEGELRAAYLSDRWHVTAATTLELGARWDEQRYLATPSNRQFSPRASVLHKLSERAELRFGVGRYFQSQGIHELQVEDGVDRFFRPQRADHVVVGAQYRFDGGYSVRTEVYRKELRDLRPRYENLFDPLTLLPELEPDRTRVAPEEATARGLEFSLTHTGPDELGWWASYTLARVVDRIAGQEVPRNWDQRHAAQLGVAWDGPRWDLGAALHVHSGWPTTALMLDVTDATNPVARPGARNAHRFSNFGSLDFRANRNLPVRVGTLDLFFEISNVTNRENPCCGDFDLEETADGSIVLEQQTDTWLPRLGSFGVLWQF